MAVNRFDRYTPIRSTYVPQEYVPDFQMLAQALQQQQGQYDLAREAAGRLPQYLQEDQEDVLAYKKLQDERMEEVNKAYRQGITQGNIAMSKFMDQVKRDFSPTGHAYGFQRNFDLFNAYQENLQEALDKGTITKDTYDAAILKSKKDFGRSYINGQFNQFDGYRTAEDVNIVEVGDNILKGWKPDTIEGKPVRILNGEYYYVGTEERVDPNDIRKAAYQAIMSDPASRAYLNQQQTLFGKDPLTLLENAGDVLAEKYGYLKRTGREFANWALKQRRAHRHDKRNDGELYGQMYNGGLIHQEHPRIDLNNVSGKEGMVPKVEAGIVAGLSRTAVPTRELRTQQQQLADKDLLSWVMSPEANRMYPGLSDIADKDSLKRGENESSDDYGKRIVEAYNQIADASSEYNPRMVSFGDGDIGKKARANARDRFLGKDGPGELHGFTINVNSPDGELQEGVSIKKLIELSGYKDEDGKSAYHQWRENASFLGLVEDGAGQVVEGSGHIRFADKKGNIYEAYVNSENNFSNLYRQTIRNSRRGYRDLSLKETDDLMFFTPTEDGGMTSVKLRFRYRTEQNSQGEYERVRDVVNPETGEVIPDADATEIERIHMALMPNYLRTVNPDR